MAETGYVVFTEDKFYLLWQTELFLHSLVNRGGITNEQIVVLYADPSYHDKKIEFGISPYMKSLMAHYPGVMFYPCQNWGRRNWYFRFNDDGTWQPRQYPGINKWLSVCEAANAGWLDRFTEVVQLEQDLWFSGTFPDLPAGNCVTENWINNRFGAFEVNDKDDQNTEGFDLDDIMKLCKVSNKNRAKWKGGAVIFKFITAQLKRGEFLNAIVNYNQLLMSLGELALPQGARHETDMVAPSLAMAHCGMDYTLLTDNRWRTDVWTWHEEIPDRTVVHYGWDFNNYKHLDCRFSKFIYNTEPPWKHKKKLLNDKKKTKFQWIKAFIDDILALSKIEMDRTCERKVAVPVI
jgi:hypothetical protein